MDFQPPLSVVLSQAIPPTEGFYISGFISAFTDRTFLSGMRKVKAKPAVRFNSRELSGFCHRIFLLPKRFFFTCHFFAFVFN